MLPFDGMLRRIPIQSILYVEVNGHKLCCRPYEGESTVTGRLKVLEQRLAERHFARCNNCYLVNLIYVRSATQEFAVVDDAPLKISRPRRKEFMQALPDYYGGGGLVDFSSDGWVSSASLVCCLSVYSTTYLSFYWLFARPLADRGAYGANFLQSSSLTILIVPIALILSLLGKLTGGQHSEFLLNQVYSMLCCAFVLWVQVSQRRAIYWQREASLHEVERAAMIYDAATQKAARCWTPF